MNYFKTVILCCLELFGRDLLSLRKWYEREQVYYSFLVANFTVLGRGRRIIFKPVLYHMKSRHCTQ
jgi:hypothetical protein